MGFSPQRKKLLKEVFFPPKIPELDASEAKAEHDEFCAQGNWEKRTSYFESLIRIQKIQLFRILSQDERVELLKHCREDDIPDLCKHLSPGEQFALQQKLGKAGAFIPDN